MCLQSMVSLRVKKNFNIGWCYGHFCVHNTHNLLHILLEKVKGLCQLCLVEISNCIE